MARTRRYELDDEDAADENGILRDGARIRVGVQMLDSAGRPLVDGLGQPLAGGSRCSGYVFVDEHKGSQRAVDHELRKAQLSAAWRGGLRAGDQLTIGDQRLDVLGYNADDRLVLADASELDREAGLDADSIKQQAYDAAVAELSNAWRTRPTVDQEPDDDIDLDQDEDDEEDERMDVRDEAAADAIRRAAWEQSVRDLQDAWKR